jgi:small subunit ribosomal protein S3
MGQKTHPLGFRLGITQDHKSTWYANFNQYANVLKKIIQFEHILILFQK